MHDAPHNHAPRLLAMPFTCFATPNFISSLILLAASAVFAGGLSVDAQTTKPAAQAAPAPVRPTPSGPVRASEPPMPEHRTEPREPVAAPPPVRPPEVQPAREPERVEVRPVGEARHSWAEPRIVSSDRIGILTRDGGTGVNRAPSTGTTGGGVVTTRSAGTRGGVVTTTPRGATVTAHTTPTGSWGTTTSTGTEPAAGATPGLRSPGVVKRPFPLPPSPESLARLEQVNAVRSGLSGVNKLRIPSGYVHEWRDGTSVIDSRSGSAYWLRANGTLASLRSGRASASFDADGRVVALRTPTLNVTSVAHGGRVITERRPDRSILVSTGRRSGYLASEVEDEVSTPPPADAAPEAAPEAAPPESGGPKVSSELSQVIEPGRVFVVATPIGVNRAQDGRVMRVSASASPGQTVPAIAPLGVPAVPKEADCSLSPGAVLRLERLPAAVHNPVTTGAVGMSVPASAIFQYTPAVLRVMASRRGECAVGIEVQLSLPQLEEMENEFRARIDDGLRAFSVEQGKDGLPTVPPATLVFTPAPAATGPAVGPQLDQLRAEASKAESQLVETAFSPEKAAISNMQDAVIPR